MKLEAQLVVSVNPLGRVNYLKAASEIRDEFNIDSFPFKISGDGFLMFIALERHSARDIALLVDFLESSLRADALYFDVGLGTTDLAIHKPEYDRILRGEWRLFDFQMRDFSEDSSSSGWKELPFRWKDFICALAIERAGQLRKERDEQRIELDQALQQLAIAQELSNAASLE